MKLKEILEIHSKDQEVWITARRFVGICTTQDYTLATRRSGKYFTNTEELEKYLDCKVEHTHCASNNTLVVRIKPNQKEN